MSKAVGVINVCLNRGLWVYKYPTKIRNLSVLDVHLEEYICCSVGSALHGNACDVFKIVGYVLLNRYSHMEMGIGRKVSSKILKKPGIMMFK